jgi:hypothetical protein
MHCLACNRILTISKYAYAAEYACKEDCIARTSTKYWTEIIVDRKYSPYTSYVIPFKYNDTWFLLGSSANDACFYRLEFITNMPFEILRIPDITIPVNDNFDTEVKALIDRFKKLSILV